MKCLFLISFVFITIAAQGQILLSANWDKTMFNKINTPQLKFVDLKFPMTEMELGENDAPNAFMPENGVTKTFKLEAEDNRKSLPMRREGIPGDLITELGPEGIEGSARVYTTNCAIGRFTFSCDYLYDDEGRLIIAEPCWQWGK